MNSVHDAEGVVRIEDLARIDLNLLVALDALARTRNVTAAAARLGVTQSAVSHALRRLRNLLGDPLLVRTRGGMLLTPRAEALVVPLRAGLNTLGRALTQPTTWQPHSARRAFTIATPDLFDVVAMPRLLERVRSEAPGVDISIVPLDRARLLQQLESGEVDAAVLPQVQELNLDPEAASAAGLVQKQLFRDRHICMLRADHPVLGKKGKRAGPLSLDTYAALSHLVVSLRGTGPGIVDHALAKHGLRRRIALRVPHFYSALSIVATCDLILTAPTALATLAAPGRIVTLEPPLKLPVHQVYLHWHERFSHDPGHTWLRELLRAVSPT